MNRHVERLVAFLIAARWPLFGVALLLAALAYFPSTHVRFDRSIEHMFAPIDPLLPPYQRLKREFGGNEVVMLVYRDDELLDPNGRGIERLAQITRRMKTVPGVGDVLSLAEVNALLEQLEKTKKLGGIFDLFRPRDHWKGPAILNPESKLAARYRELFAGYTHSADGRTVAALCMLKPATADAALNVPREETIAGLEKIALDLPAGLSTGVLAGEPIMVSEGFSLLETDGQRLGTWTLALMGLTVLVLFRDLRWLLISLAVVQWSLIVTRAALVMSSLSLSMVSSMLTAMVTVVGVAGTMHLIVEVRALRATGLGKGPALLKTGILLAGPILGAVLTDMSGFASLWCASVGPVRDFGTMMVVGAFLVLPAICLIVPALGTLPVTTWEELILTVTAAAISGFGLARGQGVLYAILLTTILFGILYPTFIFTGIIQWPFAENKDDRPRQASWEEVYLGYWLMRSIDAIHARPKTVAAIAAIVALVVSLGAVRLEVETDFTRNFRRGNRIVAAYDFVETELGGAGVWDVMIPAPPVLDQEYLARVRKLQQRLRELEIRDSAGQMVPGLTKVMGLVDAFDALDVEPTLAALTPTAELRYQAMAAAMPTFMPALRSQPDENGHSRLRIMLRARERQPADQKRLLINQVTQIAREEFPDGAEVTGFFVLLTNLIESILRDQWTTFAVSSLAILAMVWIGFRSWKYALISMIPNAVPIYMVMGLLGWAGLKMNMGAAMIAAVSMGMSVDSSIHYFSSFRHARREGKSVHAALTQCQQSVGLAMIFTTVALLIGFGVLITSEFVPTIYFGALMSLAMLGGMLGNLIVLPLLLAWTERD